MIKVQATQFFYPERRVCVGEVGGPWSVEIRFTFTNNEILPSYM